jgi:hydrogenase maturation protein HypF
MKTMLLSPTRSRIRLIIHGAVQGVGFRPFVYRLAADLGLGGWIRNSSQGVVVEIEGDNHRVEEFLLRIESEKPPLASIYSLEPSVLDVRGDHDFEILPSEESGELTAWVLPDIATCPDCLAELFDSANRRYRYPFTNCTNCGPRFSIMEALPYDRPNTTMRRFVMCAACRTEYEDPRDRRFHAQPNACAECGPHLELWDQGGERLAWHHEALQDAAEAVRAGGIVAVKGLGGFHLIVDARNEEAVTRLRRLKQREEKPFAVMVPSLIHAEELCSVSALEKRLLRSPEAPIVLLRRRPGSAQLALGIAPGNPYLGVMLPYAPLHHLLMDELGFPIVATSGNLSDETICTDERNTLERLGGVADLFLVHNRPIVNHADDSVVRIMAGRELVVRRARGFAPLPIRFDPPGSDSPSSPVLALGADLKNTIALSVGRQIFVSQHIGDLESAEAFSTFRRVINNFEQMRGIHPEAVACDDHPDYHSTRFAARLGIPVISIQHHVAHVASCMAENGIGLEPVLGIAWDGTGYGTDGTVWGGEFLRVERGAWQRVAHFRTFPLPGAEAAVKQPRRTALGVLYALLGPDAFCAKPLAPLAEFSAGDLQVLRTMLERGINCPLTSSVGRLFDAVAALLGFRQQTRYEGQAAMDVEFAADGVETEDVYPFGLLSGERDGTRPWVIDWHPMMQALLHDISSGADTGLIAAKFHNTLVEIMLTVAQRVGEERVVLTGGCFQNRYLCERSVTRLGNEGFRCYWHQRIPPNDGGIALGQAAMAWFLQNGEGG